MKGRVGVAISTTGHPHRMRFLETCVEQWMLCAPQRGVVVVTVDGSAEDVRRVQAVVPFNVNVYKVGQTDIGVPLDNRMGVAANKNTGIEVLMDEFDCEHLFLSDDDTWPLYAQSLTKHMDFEYPHSMVMWGNSRLDYTQRSYAAWKWPRGAMLYMHRDVVYRVGGMVEDFGRGGHEHAEYSQRIHNAGFTAEPFVSPASYATRNAMGAAALWHAEDMRRPGEPAGSHASRRRAITSIDPNRDWDNIHAVMARMEGSSAYVGFRAHENGRASAILSSDMPSRGADK